MFKQNQHTDEPKDRLIFALDVANRDDAMALADGLVGHVGCLKMGLELFVAEGPGLVLELAQRLPILLDLKLHDIPTTVGRAAKAASKLGAAYLTVHIDEGGRALAAAVDTFQGQSSQSGLILGVTVLTSIGPVDLARTGYANSIEQLVLHRALLAKQKGCLVLICSGHDVQELRKQLGPDMCLIVPGIRPPGTAAGDQRRVVTPRGAMLSGADMIVVGRPIRDAPSPADAADRIAEALSSRL